MRRLRLTTSATRNLKDIAQHLRRGGVDRRSIVSLINSLGAQCQKLAELPGELGRPRSDLPIGVRSFPYRGHLIFFRYDDAEMLVVHILSTRQDLSARLAWDED
jgi:toxin ParE1/3/4